MIGETEKKRERTKKCTATEIELKSVNEIRENEK